MDLVKTKKYGESIEISTMATKIQLEAMVTKILELQYYGETVHVVYFDPYSLSIRTASGKILSIDTDGKELKT